MGAKYSSQISTSSPPSGASTRFPRPMELTKNSMDGTIFVGIALTLRQCNRAARGLHGRSLWAFAHPLRPFQPEG